MLGRIGRQLLLQLGDGSVARSVAADSPCVAGE
jgi:nucleotide-binding universal stress UspA family protein